MRALEACLLLRRYGSATTPMQIEEDIKKQL